MRSGSHLCQQDESGNLFSVLGGDFLASAVRLKDMFFKRTEHKHGRKLNVTLNGANCNFVKM